MGCRGGHCPGNIDRGFAARRALLARSAARRTLVDRAAAKLDESTIERSCTRTHGRPFRAAARREAVRRDVLRRRGLEALVRARAAVEQARQVRRAEREPRHRVSPRDAGRGLHARRRGDDAVRGRRPLHDSARRRARDGQRLGRAAHRQRARNAGAAHGRHQALALRRRRRGDAPDLRLSRVRGGAHSARARGAAARRARAHHATIAPANGSRTRSCTPSSAHPPPRPAAT